MDDPYTVLERKDIVHKFLTLCSFVSICENKKLNLANVFLLVLKEKKYRDLYKDQYTYVNIPRQILSFCI